ncbi:MAG: hypothetical protein ACI83P_001996 [Janthinobacterium sp.]|jgi:hypothetical protein
MRNADADADADARHWRRKSTATSAILAAEKATTAVASLAAMMPLPSLQEVSSKNTNKPVIFIEATIFRRHTQNVWHPYGCPLHVVPFPIVNISNGSSDESI